MPRRGRFLARIVAWAALDKVHWTFTEMNHGIFGNLQILNGKLKLSILSEWENGCGKE